MDLRVDFHGGSVSFEADPAIVVAAWTGPLTQVSDLSHRIAEALESPLHFPPLRQVVVPGDRVVIAFDGSLSQHPEVLAEVCKVLRSVEVDSITVVIDGREFSATEVAFPDGVTLVHHDPSDRESLAYLATTEAGLRIYLNRLLPDADCVIPIGGVRFGDDGSVRGPWSVITPGLSDATEPRTPLFAAKPARKITKEKPTEAPSSTEVAWLLGSQFEIAIVPATEGIAEVIAGEAEPIAVEAEARLRATWLLEPESRADLVITGVGATDRPASPNDFVRALRQSLAAVQRGGKIALLCDLDLPALRDALGPNHIVADDFAHALAWADIYLHSRASADDVEELGMLAIDRLTQVGKLAAATHSLITINQGDRTFVHARS